MQALFEMSEGLERLRHIIGEFPTDSPYWNEAQNRFQFIDRLLTECLGWERPDIEVERTDESGGRADYVMGHPPKAVLEAKRESKLWNILPSGTPHKVRKIEPLLQASDTFREAVHQVIPYCSLRGAAIAVVCNGPQLAIFQAITIGQEPLKGECYLFNGFSDYIDNFPLLWTMLSPEGITENRALRDLARHRNPRIPSKASQSIPEPNKYRYRDPLQQELREIGSLLLEEIEDNPDLRVEFFRECYVPIEANNRHLLLSKQIIASRYHRVTDDGSVPSALDSVSRTGKMGDQFFTNAGSKPIVVIGDVGVGKSSFFENLYLSLGEEDKSGSYFITIDLGTKANLSEGLKKFIIDSIPEILRDRYDIDIDDAGFVKTIYHEELKRFDRTIDGEDKDADPDLYRRNRREFLRKKVDRRDAHIHAAFSHLARGRKRRIVLIIDNADQRTFDVQQEAFLIAQEFAATRSLFVFVALRPSTFYMSKTSGALSAYQNKILTISPPPADEVIQRRLTFALRVAEGKAAPAALEGIRLNLASIVHFLRATLRSVRTNDHIRQFLSNITGGNTKSVIELITSFCGSPNVDARKIVGIESEAGDYLVPLHEFTKHALLGEYSYYNPQSSLVACNVFDVSAADSREHFLASLIVGYLSSSLGTRDKDGFVAGERILEEMVREGFVEEQASSALRRLAHKRLIETPYSHYRELSVPEAESPVQFYYRATSVGIYHTRFWIGSFSFLDATSTDTPIFDEGARNSVARAAASFEISQRLAKAKAFRDYLEAKWHLGNFDVTYFDFPTVIAGQSREFEAVERVVSGQIAVRRAGSNGAYQPSRGSKRK
jgi:GTPase SAR1 family protein